MTATNAPRTPYDAILAKATSWSDHTTIRWQQEGYLRAKAEDSDLLAAAEAALEVWSVDPTHLPPGSLPEHYTRLVGSIAQLRAAIAKAKGEA